MNTREQAYNLLNIMTDADINMFINIFGRLYKNKNDSREQIKKNAFEDLESIIDSISPFSADFDENKERDEYFKEKYGL